MSSTAFATGGVTFRLTPASSIVGVDGGVAEHRVRPLGEEPVELEQVAREHQRGVA